MTIKNLFIEQFKATYDVENWFVPLKPALDNVTDEEFDKKTDEPTHSIRQLVNHLIFWNDRWLQRIKGTPKQPFSGENDLTFDDENAKEPMKELVKRLNTIMDELLSQIEKFDETKFESRVFPDSQYKDLWWESVSNIILHNAYHVGQIMLIKKQLRK